MSESDAKFVGAIPEIYDSLMVPLMFQPFAEDMAARVAVLNPGTILETAAGSGVVTRVLAPLLRPQVRYVVSDLNPPMLERARARQPQDERIEWATADAQNLPFKEDVFDVLFCQFGIMFFPDKRRGLAEARRVLKPGAPFIFNVWDQLAHNPVSEVVGDVVAGHFGSENSDFFRRVPFGYHDRNRITADLTEAGFSNVKIEALTRTGRAESARAAAVALVQGTPVRMEIVGRNPEDLAVVTEAAETALRRRFGDGPFSASLQALVVVASA